MTALLDAPLAFVDVETTGGHPLYHRIIEIGVVLARGDAIEESWTTLVDPGTWLPPTIQRLTGIDPDALHDAPPFRAIAGELAARLEGRLFVAHNARFDYGFVRNELKRVDWVAEIMAKKQKEFPGIDNYRLEQETIRDVMGTYVLDVLQETKRRLSDLKAKSADDIRFASSQTVSMSDDMKKKDRALRDFLWANFYRHHEVSRMRLKTFRVVQELFGAFMDHRRCLPPQWLAQAEATPEGWTETNWRARTVADYIASMTDRLAIKEHADLFDIQKVIG